MLQPTSIKASLEGRQLVARHEHYTVSTEVVSPENRESENGPVRAVIRMTTDLPRQVIELFKEPEATVAMMNDFNTFAALGALSSDRGKVYIGSRLTIYEANLLHRTAGPYSRVKRALGRKITSPIAAMFTTSHLGCAAPPGSWGS
jgi:hypothetical protein